MEVVSRGRFTVGNTGVVSAAANGLMLVVLIAGGLSSALQLEVGDVARGAAIFSLIMVLAIRALPLHHPYAIFGPANQITTVRAALVSVVGCLVGGPETRSVALMAVGVACIVTVLDGVDGWMARRTRMTSAFGARYDMEVDALLILALSLLAWTHDKAPAWVVWSGLLRYAFLVGGWTANWMGQPLPASRRRQTVCVIQIASLIVVMLPQIRPPLSAQIATLALAVLVWSFVVDTWWLWRHQSRRRVTVPS